MSHFYSSIKGSKGHATRCGTKDSGMSAYVTGWNVGVFVRLEHKNGKDIAYVYRNGGSNNINDSVLLMAVTEEGQL